MFLEQVWWPMMGSLEDMHPEYEVADWRGRPYFVDLVWKAGQVKFAFEVKGYGPQCRTWTVRGTGRSSTGKHFCKVQAIG
ncbi:hypothetical protein D3C75_1124020 [compost metagenome]